MKPFDIHRVENYFDKSGYHYSSDEETGALHGSWNDIPFRFASLEENQWLMVQTRWEVPDEVRILDSSRAVLVIQDAANEWNRQYLQPTGYPISVDGTWLIQLDMAVFFATPCTDEQVHLAIDRALEVHLQAHEVMGGLFSPII